MNWKTNTQALRLGQAPARSSTKVGRRLGGGVLSVHNADHGQDAVPGTASTDASAGIDAPDSLDDPAIQSASDADIQIVEVDGGVAVAWNQPDGFTSECCID